jgi:hypothetical protein
MMPVLEVFGAWCAVSLAVAGLWTLLIYLGYCYRRRYLMTLTVAEREEFLRREQAE